MARRSRSRPAEPGSSCFRRISRSTWSADRSSPPTGSSAAGDREPSAVSLGTSSRFRSPMPRR
jgi:hypothetical protein